MSNEQPSLSQAIGARLRALRTEHGLRQEQVAAYARVWGLDWTRSTVAAIEAGDRALSLEEFFALPLVYKPLQLPDLFPGDGWVDLRLSERVGWTTPESHLRDTLRGEALADAPRPAADPEIPAGVDYAIVEPFTQLKEKPGHLTRHIRPPTDEELRAYVAAVNAGEIRVPHTKVVGEWDDEAAERVFLELPRDVQRRRSEIEAAARGEAERKIARKLGVSPLLVSACAFARYHGSLAEARDEKVWEMQAQGAEFSGRTLQALRGHATRKILAELTPRIEKYKFYL